MKISSMRKSLIILLLSLFVDANATIFNPPNQQKQRYQSISDILDNPEDKIEVSLKGKITQKLFEEKYLFSDDNNEIVIEVDDKRFPLQKVTEDTTLAILGEVRVKTNRNPEVVVFLARVVDAKSNKTLSDDLGKESSNTSAVEDFATSSINKNSSF
ncbi:MAG: NirD/YgiW/YdeI family stress tolerance protein [Rickettsiales bacterium]